MNVRLDWKGDDVARPMHDAEVRAVNGALKEGVERARSSHPGWKNITGETERSITFESATRDGGRIVGKLLSTAAHFIFLEIGVRGRSGDNTLRRAGDVAAAGLHERVRTEFGR